MGVLAPMYLAGLAALSLPLIFHLVRRTPRGRQEFSSLMFLLPSPPRLTRRSRLDQILLLIMRLAALALLAFAFARPFLRRAATLQLEDLPARRVVILLDHSASMRYEDPTYFYRSQSGVRARDSTRRGGRAAFISSAASAS